MIFPLQNRQVFLLLINVLAREITTKGGKAIALKVDVSNPNDIALSAKTARKVFGDVSILINNAGIVSGKKILEASNAMIKKTFEVNTIALFYTTKEFLPSMLDRNKGQIVTIASVGGAVGSPGLIDYGASKAAAIAFDESLRQELHDMGSDVRTT